MKKFFCVLLTIALVISSLSVSAAASLLTGSISVNGNAFDGTLSEAIISAGDGGTVEISGTVFTYPIGKRDGCYVNNVTICGVNDAKLILDPDFVMAEDDNLDVLSIKGSNVTVKDIEIDATLRVDYAICVFCNTDNITIENISALRGIRGGINVMTSGNVLFSNVRANNSIQGGFVFENCEDASNVIFENCSTKGNWFKVGVILKNGYGPCRNVDASGLTCYENCFAFHDRVEGTIGGGERQEITLTAPPKDSNGNPINTDFAMYYPVLKVYQHIRFGVSEDATKAAVADVKTDKYGFDTAIYYDDLETALANVSSGGSMEELGSANIIFIWIMRILNSMQFVLFSWKAAKT